MSEKCLVTVVDHTGFHFSPCGKKAKYFEGGKHYCGIHAPSKIAERKAKRGPTQAELQWRRQEALYAELKSLRAIRCPDGVMHRWDGDGQCKACGNYATDLIDAALEKTNGPSQN